MKANRLTFRAWWPKQNKMYGPFALIGETTMFDLLNQMRIEELDEPVLMQSTGLNDKDGVEIFEGDICTLNYGFPAAVFTFKVMEIPGGLGFEGHGGTPSSGPMCEMCDCLHDITVIGNVHQHPELLETP